MDVSYFLAKVIGLYFVIFGISMLIAKSSYQEMLKDVIAHPAVILMGGSISLLLGVLIVVNHNIWDMNWRLLITLIGWIILIRGFIWTTFPKKIQSMVTKYVQSSFPYYISTVIMIVLGLILCFIGFGIGLA